MTDTRTPEQIRASIEAHRNDLAKSVTELTVGVNQVTDWRRHVRRHPKEIAGGAAAIGFLLGGGIVALGGLLSR